MSDQPFEWNTRLAVHYTDPDGKDVVITPIQAFAPTFATGAEAVPSLEATHVGVVRGVTSFTFTMSVPATGPAAGKLTAMALQGTRFTISLQEQTGDDWSFTSIVMRECVITNAQPTTAALTGIPLATFAGFSLAVESTDDAGTKTTSPVPS